VSSQFRCKKYQGIVTDCRVLVGRSRMMAESKGDQKNSNTASLDHETQRDGDSPLVVRSSLSRGYGPLY
jgi:hypothetical protein